MEKTTMLGLCLTFIILAHCVSVESAVWVSLNLLRYSNPTHTYKDGTCCSPSAGTCHNCNNKFIICLDDNPAGSNSMDDCSVSKIVTGVYFDDDDIKFDYYTPGDRPDIRIGHTEEFTGWLEVRFQVLNMYDKLIDEDTISLSSLPIYKSVWVSKTSEHTIGTKTSFTFGVSVYCLNEINGRFTCDTDTGAKICNSGWTGVNCDVAVTTPPAIEPATTEPAPTARDLPLAGKPVYQSSMMTVCDGSTFPAHFATDGDMLTFSSTSNVSGRSPWWLVDLEDEFCLSKIIVLLPQDAGGYRSEPTFAGAVARAGGHSFYALNEPCGQPATKEESRPNGTIISCYFASLIRMKSSLTLLNTRLKHKRHHMCMYCDPPRRARYVSLDIDRFHPGDAAPVLQIAEINIKESLDPNCGRPSR